MPVYAEDAAGHMDNLLGHFMRHVMQNATRAKVWRVPFDNRPGVQ
jgi:hypothetical protein